MTNAELITQFRTEIERRLKDYWKICFHDVKTYNEDSNVRELKELLSFLSTLESKKPMNQGLDKEIEEISIHVPCSEFTHESEYVDLLDWLKEQFTYFYDLGCRHTAEKYDEIEYNRQRASGSSEIPKDLEEAAEKYAGDSVSDEGMMEVAAFIAGAKWQKEQDDKELSDLLTIAHLQGAEQMKEQMMKDAVDATLDNTAYPTRLWFNTYLSEYSNNDKVHVIIVKEDEK